MRTIVIFKQSDPSERITLRTDLMYDDYESNFTVMSSEGNIEGVDAEFRIGSVISIQTISNLLANNDGISAVLCSPESSQVEVEEAVAKMLSLDLFIAYDERTYNEYVPKNYREKYSYDDSKDSMPWLIIKTFRNVPLEPFDVEVSHEGTACEFSESCSAVGEISESGKKLTITTDKNNFMFECLNDLGVDEPEGSWRIKVTIGDFTYLRETSL